MPRLYRGDGTLGRLAIFHRRERCAAATWPRHANVGESLPGSRRLRARVVEAGDLGALAICTADD